MSAYLSFAVFFLIIHEKTKLNSAVTSDTIISSFSKPLGHRCFLSDTARVLASLMLSVHLASLEILACSCVKHFYQLKKLVLWVNCSWVKSGGGDKQAWVKSAVKWPPLRVWCVMLICAEQQDAVNAQVSGSVLIVVKRPSPSATCTLALL